MTFPSEQQPQPARPSFPELGDLGIRFQSLGNIWPGEPTQPGDRQRAPFVAPWLSTVRLLKRELEQLGATSIRLEMDCDESQIRRDGMPRADARTRGPGVVLSFSSPRAKSPGNPAGALRYPCDTYTRWEDNLRAIALALEALRKVDRYGVTRRGEQYAGFKALPGAGASTVTLSAEQAAGILAELSAGRFTAAELLRDPAKAKRAYHASAAATHPDQQGGSELAFHRVADARRALDAHHGAAR